MKTLAGYFIKVPSISVIILICLTIIEIHFNLVRWNNKNVIIWDVLGYYSCLPSIFTSNDIKLRHLNDSSTKQVNTSKYVAVKPNDGYGPMKFSIGMAVLYAPFFMTAHALAQSLGYESDGYSPIYHFFIEFSGLFYLLFGLIYLRKTLLLFYNEKITALSLFFIFFGTNLLCYSSFESAMSHAYTFSLFSIFIYYNILFLKSPNLKFTIYLAILFGLIVLVRPINIMFLLAIFLLGVSSFKDFKNRVKLFIKHYQLTLTFLLLLFLVILPQLLYWKYVTGHFFYFSYGNERFYFNNPHIIDSLFSFRKGWFIYTPLIIFSMIGIAFMVKQKSSTFFYLIVILLSLYLYVTSSWWCWWYGGSFSQRALIDLYPLLTISLGACFYRISLVSKTKKVSIYSVMAFLLLLNLFQTAQYKYNIIHYDSMTFKSYLDVFGSLDSKKVDQSLLNHPDNERAVVGLND